MLIDETDKVLEYTEAYYVLYQFTLGTAHIRFLLSVEFSVSIFSLYDYGF